MRKKEIKLHLGSGTNVIEGWDNLDIEPRDGAIVCNLAEPLNYKENSVDIIFTEHVIEHLKKDDGYNLLKECYRVLKPGGGIRVGWPDLHKLMVAYKKEDQEFKNFVLPYIENNLFKSWDEIFSDCLFSWDHEYAYTSDHMQDILKLIGFNKVKVKSFGKSDVGIYHDVRDDPATTYVECIKPA